MVYDTEDCWVFGRRPSSGVLENTGSVSVLLYLMAETDPVPETSCFLFSRIPDDGKSKKKNPRIIEPSVKGSLMPLPVS
jgi:hypothetical protein